MDKLNLIKNIYIYALSGVTLIIFLVSITNTLTKIPDVLYPTSYYTQTFPEYKQSLPPNDTRPATEINAELEKRNQQMRDQEQLNQKKQLFNNAIWSLVSAVAFAYFHRERKSIEKHR